MENNRVMKQKYKKNIATAALIFFVGIVCITIFQNNKKRQAAQSLFAMDTYMEITAYGKNSEVAVAAAAAELQRLDALLSTGSNTSEVTRINQQKTANLSDDTAYLLERSQQIYQDTQGAFDITIYPIMKLWGFAGDTFHVPTQKELDAVLPGVDMSALCYQKENKTLTIPEASAMDFGGIAKGYASDRAAEILKNYGIESAIMNLGGNVRAIGTKTDGSLWRVGIRTPDGSQPYLGTISVKDKAVITSGGYERYFEENGIVYHHIIDPKTGKPAQNGLVSVTIVCEDGTTADGLSTALYVMGTEKALTFWQQYNQVFDAVLLDEEENLYVTEGLQEVFSSERDYKIYRREK